MAILGYAGYAGETGLTLGDALGIVVFAALLTCLFATVSWLVSLLSKADKGLDKYLADEKLPGFGLPQHGVPCVWRGDQETTLVGYAEELVTAHAQARQELAETERPDDEGPDVSRWDSLRLGLRQWLGLVTTALVVDGVLAAGAVLLALYQTRWFPGEPVFLGYNPETAQEILSQPDPWSWPPRVAVVLIGASLLLFVLRVVVALLVRPTDAMRRWSEWAERSEAWESLDARVADMSEQIAKVGRRIATIRRTYVVFNDDDSTRAVSQLLYPPASRS